MPPPAAPPSQPPPATMPMPVAPSPPAAGTSGFAPPPQATDVRSVAWLEAAGPVQPSGNERHLDLNIPAEIPGAEAPRIALPDQRDAKQREIERLYPPLPPLPAEPAPLPGPGGRSFTLADLQQIAAANSPVLRQAASDVEAAKGALITADAYPNPTLSYNFTPSNDGSTPSGDGLGITQTIRTGGKQGLARASAEMALHNAELALKRARSDLSTQVRNAYFAVLVGRETVRVNRALAHFTDEVYRLQVQMLLAGQAAPYEPAALRGPAYSARLAYKQSIQTYIYAWKQLVATINLRQLPLTEVGGRVDSYIPLYEYDALLAYVLRNHTDMLTAVNGVEIARYNLKLAQVTPVPDVSVGLIVTRDYSVEPKQTVPSLTLGVPLPVWDRNKGGVMSAEAALIRAEEEPHRVELNLTNTLAGAFANYKTNLDALEDYRRFILPDEVRAYRGAYDRRHIDLNASFGDVVAAQQTFAGSVSTYLTTLGQLWSSVTAVADLIQTDDLFQFARPEAVPPLPGLEELPSLPCCHPCASPQGNAAGPAANGNMMPAPAYVPKEAP
jgi:cobalt-zinc-cadmium efflux system outer membrane protein